MPLLRAGVAIVGTMSGAPAFRSQRPPRARRRERWDVLAVVGLGGALGTLLRARVSAWLPHAAGQVPWSTLLVNVVGCAAIGVFMVVISQALVSHRLLRPFVSVGVLGGLTTFSTYAVDVAELVLAGRPRLALGYLAGTVLATLAAVVLGVLGMRGVLRWTRAEGGRR